MSFNSDGFTVGDNSDSGNYVNLSANTYVAWCWKAGNDTTQNSEGTVTVTTSVNQDAGFSIITGTTINVEANDMTETFGHGLNTTPDMFLIRNLEHSPATQNARIFFPPLTDTNLKGLSLTDAELFTNSTFKTGEINGNLIGIGREMVESNGSNFIVYAWHAVEGYSKFGSYIGNGASGTAGSKDGAFVYLGFKPALFIQKSTTAGTRWLVYDNKRNTSNPIIRDHTWNDNSAENTGAENAVDFLSNGVKMRDTTNDNINKSGVTYFYMAWAEMPFKYATAS